MYRVKINAQEGGWWMRLNDWLHSDCVVLRTMNVPGGGGGGAHENHCLRQSFWGYGIRFKEAIKGTRQPETILFYSLGIVSVKQIHL